MIEIPHTGKTKPFKSFDEMPEHTLRQNIRYFINVMIPEFKYRLDWTTGQKRSSILWAQNIIKSWQAELQKRKLPAEPETPIEGYDIHKEQGKAGYKKGD